MTKKEVVSTLRKRFNNWCSSLPDVEYKSCNDHAEQILPDGWTNGLVVLELAAEVMDEEEAWLEQDATSNERKRYDIRRTEDVLRLRYDGWDC